MPLIGSPNAGRPRKPTAIKALAGTLQPCRTNLDEPQSPPVEVAAPPAGMTALEQRLWSSWAAVLNPRRVVTEADLPALERLVQVHAIVVEAQRSLYADAVDGHPQLVVEVCTKHGVSYQPRTELRIIAQFEKLLMYWFTRFGVTPADKSRASQLAAVEDEADDDVGEFVQ